jgi:hypothetical protein
MIVSPHPDWSRVCQHQGFKLTLGHTFAKFPVACGDLGLACHRASMDSQNQSASNKSCFSQRIVSTKHNMTLQSFKRYGQTSIHQSRTQN